MNKFKVGDKVVIVNPDRYANRNNVEAIKKLTNETLVVQSVCSDTDVVFAGLPGKMARPWFMKDLRLSPEVWVNVGTGSAKPSDAWVLEWDQDEQTGTPTPEAEVVTQVEAEPEAEPEAEAEVDNGAQATAQAQAQTQAQAPEPADKERHYWIVVDKNGKRVSDMCHSIASAAADLSRLVEELLSSGYSFQKVAVTIRPVLTVRVCDDSQTRDPQ